MERNDYNRYLYRELYGKDENRVEIFKKLIVLNTRVV